MSRFLLVSMNIDVILKETTRYRRRQKLNAMTDGSGLGGAYSATLDRIKGQDGGEAKLGMDTLMWIFHAERPLKPDELLHALAVEIGSPDLNSDNIPSIGTVLYCCQGLVTIDKEASTVRLIHTTLHEYLRVHPELFGGAHSTIAETCLSYLNSQQVKALSSSPFLENLKYPFSDLDVSPLYPDTPFLGYSSLYWGIHAKRNLSDCAKLLALKLFDDYKNQIPAKILVQAQKDHYDLIDYSKISLFSGLHCASVFGIDEIVASLVEVEGCDINQYDCAGKTPLLRAARNGHEGVVNILLGRDEFNPEKLGERGETPLSYAAENGHEGVVNILLGRDDVDPEKPGYFDETPLCFAAANGHEGVVKILLGRDDVNPDKPGRCKCTPLYNAAENGHEGVVKILLGRDGVNPEKSCDLEQTPLYRAAGSGHEGVVKILLGRDDVNPDKPGLYEQTPLSYAAERGHEGVVKILLGRDVNPGKPDLWGRTSLYFAAQNGHEGVVKILLERDDVNPNKPDDEGQTPLSRAVENGHAGVVALLQPLAPTTPSTPSGHGARGFRYRHR